MSAEKCCAMGAAVGLSLNDVTGYIGKLADLLQNDGASVADFVRCGLKLVQSGASGDLVGIFTALSAGEADYKQLAADIRTAFGL